MNKGDKGSKVDRTANDIGAYALTKDEYDALAKDLEHPMTWKPDHSHQPGRRRRDSIARPPDDLYGNK